FDFSQNGQFCRRRACGATATLPSMDGKKYQNAFVGMLVAALMIAGFAAGAQAQSNGSEEQSRLQPQTDAIVDAFAALLAARDTGAAGRAGARIAGAIERLRACLVENELGLLASTALDPGRQHAAPAVLLNRLLENRDEVVHTCVLYQIQPHRVGIDRTPP